MIREQVRRHLHMGCGEELSGGMAKRLLSRLEIAGSIHFDVPVCVTKPKTISAHSKIRK